MNPVAEEIKSYIPDDANDLAHYGMPKRSGRYPWGSGGDPYQHSRDFLSRVEELKKRGWTETPENIEIEFGIKTKEYRMEKSFATYQRKLHDVATAESLKKDGLGATEIGKKMGINESTVRSLLNPTSVDRMEATTNTINFLKKQVDEKGMIDIGPGVERELNISRTRMDMALHYLQSYEDYPVYSGGMAQVTNRQGQRTTQQVLCKPGTEHKEIYNYDNVKTVTDYISRDGGDTYGKKFNHPESLDSKRLQIRYNEEGGLERDGTIELRRNVPDLSLGESRYSQVRIMVDGTHYLKGMALYSDKMPDGVDVIFNTNKKKGTPMTDVLKKIKDDPDNPFGSAIKDADQGGQYWYDDPKTGKKKLGLINKRADEGDWSDWKDKLPSQFLGKQSVDLAHKQLTLAKIDRENEFDEICSLTNPTIKKHLLEKFASGCDSDAVNLKAAALPGQKYHVILPVNNLKDTEIYAPKYQDGSKLALVRYPHGGTFEIPILTVNNKNMYCKKTFGTDIGDAVGINSKVAERLSGADFDGDTVMCIPTHDKAGRVKIASIPALKDLEGFDPKVSYGGEKKIGSDGKTHYYRNGSEYPIMSEKYKQKQMGIVSNLITDMTLKGAAPEELAAAVKHSMVVIDAEKHKLDYKASEVDNNIAALHKAYQGKTTGGASTLLSRSKGQAEVLKRQGTPKVNMKGESWYDPSRPEGALLYKTATGKDLEYTVSKINKKTGEITTEIKQRTQKSSRMAETDDARSLISEANTPMEREYASYANSMKALANKARKTMMTTDNLKYNKDAKATYAKEVSSLEAKLNTALLNSTRERAAQRMANSIVKTKTEAYKEVNNGKSMPTDDVKKISQKALASSREKVGSVSRRERNIKISDSEWNAIQKGAITESKLKQILNNADIDELRQRATPKTRTTLSASKINRIKAMAASNCTLAEIAERMNLSSTTVSNYLKGVK